MRVQKIFGDHAERLIRRFAASCQGIAAVEFTLVAPLMISMYFGVTELSDGYTAGSKVTAVASSAADLVAQKSSICDADMTDVFAAVSEIIYPYPLNNMSVTITSVIDGGSAGVYKVAWSNTQNGTARTVNTNVALPTGLITTGSGGSVIMSEVTYSYSSPTGHLIYGSVPLSAVFYLAPRRVAQIPRTTTTCTSP